MGETRCVKCTIGGPQCSVCRYADALTKASSSNRIAALEAKVARLTHRLESMPPFPGCGGSAEPMDDDQMRALMLRWSTGPERYQADADALIVTARHWREEVARLRAALVESSMDERGATHALSAARANVARLTAERDAAQRHYTLQADLAGRLEAEVARLRLPAEVVETIRGALHRERRWTLRVREVDSCLAAFNAAHPESEAT